MSLSELDLQPIREKLVLAREFLMGEGLASIFGHISYYLPDENLVLLTPTTASAQAPMQPEDVVEMRLSGEVLAGKGEPPKEYVIHTAIHAARRDALSVIHTHPVYSLSLTLARQPIRPIYMHGAALKGPVPVYDDPDLVTTDEQSQRVVKALQDAPAVELRGHGSVTVGRSIEEAFAVAVFLEDNSRKQLLASQAGQPQFLSQDEIDRLSRSTIHDALFRNHWDFYTKYRRRGSEARGG